MFGSKNIVTLQILFLKWQIELKTRKNTTYTDILFNLDLFIWSRSIKAFLPVLIELLKTSFLDPSLI